MQSSTHTVGGRSIDDVVRDAPEPEFKPYPWYVRYPLIAAMGVAVWVAGYQVCQSF